MTAYLLPGEKEKLQRVRYGEKICYAPVVKTAQAGSVEYRLGDCVVGTRYGWFTAGNRCFRQKKNPSLNALWNGLEIEN